MTTSITSLQASLHATEARAAQSAERVANLNTPGSQTDLAREVANQIQDSASWSASLGALSVQDQMLGETVDLVG
jgi:flagellar hook protein FlgE